jgi:LmbE family N-acetylglucosaminyl deacetylase
VNILIIAPHHDDEVLGCGGTIIKYHKKRDKIWIVYITAGWSGLPKMKLRKKAVKIREKEAQKACKILGAEKPIFLKEKDRNISDNTRIVRKLIKIIRRIKPDFIYTPHPNEKDAEHKTSYKMTKEASWLSKSPYFLNLGRPIKSIKAIYLYEVWTPLQNFFVKEDITNEINVKIKALLAYKSQTEHSGLVDAIIGLNAYRGSMTATTKKFSEVFQIERP